MGDWWWEVGRVGGRRGGGGKQYCPSQYGSTSGGVGSLYSLNPLSTNPKILNHAGNILEIYLFSQDACHIF
jgi:hypothetical protein